MIDVDRLCPGCMGFWEDTKQPCPRCGFSWSGQPAPGRELPLFTILSGRYLLGRKLGSGGFGITYLAMDLLEERPVAIKEFFPVGLSGREGKEICPLPGEEGRAFREALRAFHRESELMARFRDARGIVSWQGFAEENGTAYLIMDYVPGETLMQHLRRTGTVFSQQEALDLMLPILRAVDGMHRQHVLHRDISPENLILKPDGTLTLIDFGAAREFDLEGEENLTVVLKHGYAPEEQYRSGSRQGPWTDLYACCAVLYQMVSGIRPQDADQRREKDRLVPLDEIEGVTVTHGFARAIEKGLTVHATERYPSIQALLEDLEPAVTKPPVPPPKAVTQPLLEKKKGSAQEPFFVQEKPPHMERASPSKGSDWKENPPPSGPQRRKLRPLWIKAIAAVVALGALLFLAQYFHLVGGSSTAADSSQSESSYTSFLEPGAVETEEDQQLVELLSAFVYPGDSLTAPQQYSSADEVMQALQEGKLDWVVGAEILDLPQVQEEGYCMIPPISLDEVPEQGGPHYVLTLDMDTCWDLIVCLLESGYYPEEGFWYGFFSSVQDMEEENTSYLAQDSLHAQLMEPYLDYWSAKSGVEYNLVVQEELSAEGEADLTSQNTGSSGTETTSQDGMPELITLTGTIPTDAEDETFIQYGGLLYQYDMNWDHPVRGFSGGLKLDSPVTLTDPNSGETVSTSQVVLLTGIIPPAPYEDIEVLRFDDFEAGKRYSVQGFWIDPAEYWGQGSWQDEYLFGPTHSTEAGEWYTVYFYGHYLFVPVSAQLLE